MKKLKMFLEGLWDGVFYWLGALMAGAVIWYCAYGVYMIIKHVRLVVV